MSKSLKRVEAALLAGGVPAGVLEMPGETRTAEQAAQAAGCALDQIVKSIIFRGGTSGEALLFLTAGGQQVDPARAATLAREPLERADAGFVRAATGFAIGGVAPVGHLTPPRSFLDSTLQQFDLVYAAAGTPRHIFPITPAALARLTNAAWLDFIVR